jgi:hypothetical protein
LKFRRYYPKGSKHKFVINDEQFKTLVDTYGQEEALERDNASLELIPESKQEMKEAFFNSCDNVLKNTGFYLNNLDKIPTFGVNISEIFPKKKK